MQTYAYIFYRTPAKDTCIFGDFGSKISRSDRPAYKPKTRSALNESAFYANNLVNNAMRQKGARTTTSTMSKG